MNVHELPMIIFTILAQMSVGAFVVLGAIQVIARVRGRVSGEELDRLTDPTLYAIGVTLVLGLVASIAHLGNLVNVFDVVRHVGSSWLSREIILGIAFAGLGFIFAATQWFKWGSAGLRQALAAVTALVGIALVYAMSMIYTTLAAVPAWNTWVTPVQFFTTTLLLGSLAVGAALMGTLMWRRRSSDDATDVATTDPGDLHIIATALRGIAVLAIVMLGVVFVVTPLHLAALSQGDAAAVASAEVFSGAWFITRLLLVFVGAGLLGVFVFRFTRTDQSDPRPLAVVATLAFGLVFVGEFMGRSLFYDQMMRIGM